MPGTKADDYTGLYAGFNSPISQLDCGSKCAPYNENGIPFCCDTRHIIPSAYLDEWDFLKTHTDLWHLWESNQVEMANQIQQQVPPGQVLIECLGYASCQRNFRSITCRTFPFFPFITQKGEFIGISYYWEFEDRCWVISNLQVVKPEFIQEMIATMDVLFYRYPTEVEQYRYHSATMRRVFSRRGRQITIFGRDGNAYKTSPKTGFTRHIPIQKFPKFGVYKIAASLPYPGEID